MPANTAATGLFGVLSLLSGGVGIKVVERMFATRDKRISEAAVARQEIRTELKDTVSRMDRLETELDTWKGKYYVLLAETVELRQKFSRATLSITWLRGWIEQYGGTMPEPPEGFDMPT